jgi:DNA-binding CsgD family transcriptional regulator
VSGNAAVEHLREAHALTIEPVRKARTALVLGHELFLLLLRSEESDAVFTKAPGELAGADPEVGLLLEAGLITNAMHVRQLHRGALARLERIRRRPRDGTVGEKILLSLLAYHDARVGASAAVAVPLARRALAGGALVRAAEMSSVAFVPPCMVLAMADLDDALAIYDDALTEAHRRGSIITSATTKTYRAQAYVFRGDLAEAEGREAFAAAEAWGTTSRASVYLAAILAEALMERGKLGDARAALNRSALGESLPEDARLLFLPNIRARLRMLNGDLVGGLEDMVDTGRHSDALGGRNPAFMAWRSPAALALLQLGDRDEARRLAAEELELARTWGAPRALGAALRAAGLAEGGECGLGLLEEAVEVLTNSPAKLEHAKARTELGAALRRANRRSEAREQLRRAAELATICGARPLAARANTELQATGARPRRIALSGVESLTPSERRVARMAAEGPTNREIAQALFVTPKTVEIQLSSVYRKLGISSRAQLPTALAEPSRRYVSTGCGREYPRRGRTRLRMAARPCPRCGQPRARSFVPGQW